MWRERESSLADFSGFEQFMLLKIDNDKEEDAEGNMISKNPGYTQFVSHTVWAHQMDFEEWKRSQAFKKSHGGAGKEGEKPSFVAAGGMSKMGDYILEHPVPSLYHAVVMEPVPPEHAGGLWDFENEPSYFDGDM
ncbi:unnamed protein product [Laminaria digitata]